MTYKLAKIKGFSFFCDWEEIGSQFMGEKLRHGNVDLDKLLKDDLNKTLVDRGEITDPEIIR